MQSIHQCVSAVMSCRVYVVCCRCLSPIISRLSRKDFSIATVSLFCMLLKHCIWLNKQRLFKYYTEYRLTPMSLVNVISYVTLSASSALECVLFKRRCLLSRTICTSCCRRSRSRILVSPPRHLFH